MYVKTIHYAVDTGTRAEPLEDGVIVISVRLFESPLKFEIKKFEILYDFDSLVRKHCFIIYNVNENKKIADPVYRNRHIESIKDGVRPRGHMSSVRTYKAY